jgi:eukaryotic-like serine/threonine-protein kinase
LIAGRYRIERPLGRSAFAVVDLAHDVELDRAVALKRLAENLSHDGDSRARLLREGRLAARLAHPNIVRVYDVGEDDGRPFIAMELVEGGPAGAGPLPEADVVPLGVQLCSALAAVHEAGLVHGDIRLRNLLLRPDGTLKIRVFEAAEHGDASTDVHAAGAVLYELLTGSPPRPTGTEPPPGRLAPVIMRCLAADPSARPSAAELGRALADDGTLVLPSAAPRRRPTARGALIALSVVAIVGGAAAIATNGGSSPKPAAPARVAPVRPGASAQQQAENLSAWLQRYSG